MLRGAGLRLGELLDFELDSVVDYGPAGSWLRVPLGKLDTERSVPLEADTRARRLGRPPRPDPPLRVVPPTSCATPTPPGTKTPE